MVGTFVGILMAADIIGLWESPSWFWSVVIIYGVVITLLAVLIGIIKIIEAVNG